VSFFIDKIESVCVESKLSFKVDYEAKEEGYYAAHSYISFPCDIPKMIWDTQTIDSYIEIQITTQLQEVIIELDYFAEKVTPLRSQIPPPEVVA